MVKDEWGERFGSSLFWISKSINHVLVRHEQAAVHAADRYARATGKPGVARQIGTFLL